MSGRGSAPITIREDLCKGCGLCIHFCPKHALRQSCDINRLGFHPAEYIGENCNACGICFEACPEPSGIRVVRE
jgi:Pyruvate/2-oxoacid:ferredoxin oxidoreductase delta subunit